MVDNLVVERVIGRALSSRERTVQVAVTVTGHHSACDSSRQIL